MSSGDRWLMIEEMVYWSFKIPFSSPSSASIFGETNSEEKERQRNSLNGFIQIGSCSSSFSSPSLSNLAPSLQVDTALKISNSRDAQLKF